MTDQQLIQQYVRRNSQAAFSQIVARHLNFVYTVCRRETGDAALADDVTQVVFLLLARKAPSLRAEASLSGWLFQTARFASKNARRREASRKTQEQAVAEQMSSSPDKNALWDQIEPHLNAALAALTAKDREAVLLRFADGLSFPELSAALGTSEDAARMRLNRAVSRLRQSFAGAGIPVSLVILAGLLAERTVQAAPSASAALVAKISGSEAAVSLQVSFHLQGVTKAMTLKKLKIAAALSAGLAAAGIIPAVLPAQNHSRQTVSTPPVPTIPAGANQDASAVLAQATQATNALHSLSADVEMKSSIEMDAVVPPAPWGLVAHLKLKRPAQELSETPGLNGQTSIVNGKDFWFYMHWNKQYQREADLDLSKDRIGAPVFSSFFFNPGRDGLNFSGLTAPAGSQTRLLGTVQWDGETDTAVQITRPVAEASDKDPMTGTFTAYFGADHLLHGFSVDVVYRGKRTVEEYALKNLRINPEIPDSAFVFVPPTGSQPTQPPVGGLPPGQY